SEGWGGLGGHFGAPPFLTLDASAPGTLVALGVIGRGLRGRAARVAAIHRRRRRMGGGRRRGRAGRGRGQRPVTLAALAPPRRDTIGRLAGKRARRRILWPADRAPGVGPGLRPRRRRPRLGALSLEPRWHRRALALDLAGAEGRAWRRWCRRRRRRPRRGHDARHRRRDGR